MVSLNSFCFYSYSVILAFSYSDNLQNKKYCVKVSFGRICLVSKRGRLPVVAPPRKKKCGRARFAEVLGIAELSGQHNIGEKIMAKCFILFVFFFHFFNFHVLLLDLGHDLLNVVVEILLYLASFYDLICLVLRNCVLELLYLILLVLTGVFFLLAALQLRQPVCQDCQPKTTTTQNQ